MTQRRSETHSTSLCQYDLICPTGNQFFAKQSDVCRQRLLARQRSAAQLARLHSLRYDLSAAETVFRYDVTCPDSCETCPLCG